jgi:hypothetical protein
MEIPLNLRKSCGEKGRLLCEYHEAVSAWSRVTEEDLGPEPFALTRRAVELRAVALTTITSAITAKLLQSARKGLVVFIRL